MMLHSRRELEAARAKLRQMEERHATVAAQPAEAGSEKVREWTLLSLKKLIRQFQEEIARFQARAGNDRP